MLEVQSCASGWPKVAFGDVVRLSTERSRESIADGFERFVGLDHIDPGDLRIRRWGYVADGTTFTNVFRPGQVLFGKRRAYQRKVAVADFAGVCSGDIYVLESKDSRLLPELLPFLCQMESFVEHAISTSAGSLSPRTNWRSLAAFEFRLPPVEEQLGLVNGLLASEEAIYAMDRLRASLEQVQESIVEAFTSNGFDRCRLGDVLTSTSYGTSTRSSGDGTGVPVLGIPNVRRGHLEISEFNRVSLSEADVAKYSLQKGDLLIVRTNGNPAFIGRCALVGSLPQEFVYASYLIRLRADETRVEPGFLAAVLNAPSTRRAFRMTARSSAGNYNINTKEIRSIEVPLPPLEDQADLLGQLESVRLQEAAAETRLAHLIGMKRLMLQEVVR